ncbi:uncharacterized protein LOC108117024 [Drosophila eugracilis]|uniref:uncharacterized protein LOC108117024 n=1 Tax=Drosophila eugracilis TaxID=29029 RepID=UPI001BDA612F|nr:uncharacterized protein LOC108117024 [Drosophila eugracilis]
MQAKRCFFGLIILFTFFERALQEDSKNGEPENPTKPTPLAATKEAPLTNEPETDADVVQGTKCKPNEMFSEHGCVDREYFMNKMILRSWKDSGFSKSKARAGLANDIECKENEVRTPMGCENSPFPLHRTLNRVRVHHSSLNRDRVVFSNVGSGRGVHQEPSKHGKERNVRYFGPPISAHNRPRKNYILPGRLLESGRKCRPYEVLGKDGLCHHRKGKTGNYEHKNHVYGLQLRHRHEAHKDQR